MGPDVTDVPGLPHHLTLTAKFPSLTPDLLVRWWPEAAEYTKEHLEGWTHFLARLQALDL